MNASHIDTQLGQLELQCRQAQTSLLDGDSATLQSAGKTLLGLTVELSQLARSSGQAQWTHPNDIQRIKALAAAVATLREGVLRQLAYVERGLEIVVPATRDKATYGAAGGYGSPVRQSGSFSYLSA